MWQRKHWKLNSFDCEYSSEIGDWMPTGWKEILKDSNGALLRNDAFPLLWMTQKMVLCGRA